MQNEGLTDEQFEFLSYLMEVSAPLPDKGMRVIEEADQDDLDILEECGYIYSRYVTNTIYNYRVVVVTEKGKEVVCAAYRAEMNAELMRDIDLDF